MTHKLTTSVTLESESSTSLGSRMRKQFVRPSSQSRSASYVTCWDMCFWYQTGMSSGMEPVRWLIMDSRSVS